MAEPQAESSAAAAGSADMAAG
eukprot:SAG11_NODE_27705_length_330_cov_0.614719_1_plen_21_part_10